MKRKITPPHCVLALILICTAAVPAIAQQEKRNTAVFLSLEYLHTTYDRTKFGNPDAAGFGAQVFFNRRSMFQPVAEAMACHFSSDDVLRTDPDGNEVEGVSEMVNLMGGAAFVPFPYVSLSVVAGPSFMDNGTRFALKPTLALYFPRNQRFSFRFSLLNVFDRDKATRQDFRATNLTFAVRVY